MPVPNFEIHSDPDRFWEQLNIMVRMVNQLEEQVNAAISAITLINATITRMPGGQPNPIPVPKVFTP